MSVVGKLIVMFGVYVYEKFWGVFYGKVINLLWKLCEEYDKVLEFYDVLVLLMIVIKFFKV